MDLSATLERLAHEPQARVDLAELALHLARDEYPNLDVEAYLSQFDGLAHEGRSYLGRTLAAQVAGLSRFLFHDVGFHGNQEDYYDPRNSFLNEVLDRQTGIPITLSLVAIAVGTRLGLRVDGVALPGHFVALARRGSERIAFDPFNGGRVLQIDDCRRLVRESAGLEIDLTLDGLEPASTAAVVTRILTNLKGCYLRRREFRKAVRVLKRLRQIVPDDWAQARDLGACYLQAGQAGKAIDALNLYLEQSPYALDREAAQKLLRRARVEVAKWN